MRTHEACRDDIPVVDTVGAGDCFLAGLVVATLARRLPADWGTTKVDVTVVKDLLASAIASASLCVMQRGCVPPTRAEVQARVAGVAMDLVL